MSSDIAVSVDGLTKSYRVVASPARELAALLFGCRAGGQAFLALEGVAFDVQRGETLGIIGRNGAGKSTLLQIICGTLSPTAGGVRVNGRLAALLELGAGFNPEFSGRENVYLSAAVYGLGRGDIAERMADILAFAEIGDFIDQPVKTYSSGMFVRLAFAVIAHVDADILVIDEALAVGDVYFTQKCMRFLREFATRGTLLFVSHDIHSVVTLCQRAIWLEGGRLKMIGAARDVSDAYIASAYENRLPEPSADAGTLAPAGSAAGDAADGDGKTAGKVRREFGLGGARILRCQLFGEDGAELHLHDRAQMATLEVEWQALSELSAPIVGFHVKDRLGQPLCGENTVRLLAERERVAEGVVELTTFRFWLPRMATGDYTITVSIADGTQQTHVQHHWIHDVLAFKAQADVSFTGLFGLDRLVAESARSRVG